MQSDPIVQCKGNGIKGDHKEFFQHINRSELTFSVSLSDTDTSRSVITQWRDRKTDELMRQDVNVIMLCGLDMGSEQQKI